MPNSTPNPQPGSTVSLPQIPIPKSQSAQRRLRTEILVVVGFALVLILVLPWLLSVLGGIFQINLSFRLNLLGRFLALAIAALGIDLIWGYTGLLSLGHGIFFALGGYCLAMYLQLQIPAGQLPEFFTLYGVADLPFFWQPFYSFPFTLAAIVVLPTVLAALLGYLVFRNRIRGVYFSILTQAALIVFFNFFNGQQELINGTNGLKTDTTTLFGLQVGDPPAQRIFYILSVIFLALAYGLCRWLTSGRLGKLLVAIRDDESRTRFSGYNPTEYKVLVFAVSAGLAGIAGALYTVQSGIITPQEMSIARSIEMVIWVAVGGRGTLSGAVLGTLLVNFARSLLSESFSDIWQFFQGGLFLLVVTVLPSGLVGWWQANGWQQLMQRFFPRQPPHLATYPQLEQDIRLGDQQQDIYERQNPSD
jgi:urea transport system permease protein